MSFTVVKETTDFLWVITKQLERIDAAASNIDFSSRHNLRNTLLKYVMAVRTLYVDVSAVVDVPDFSKVLDDMMLSLLDGNGKALDIIKALEEIRRTILRRLKEENLLYRVSSIGVST